MANEYIGREESVGFGIEATAGTAVAPQMFVAHLKNGLKPQTTKIENNSAMGRVERVNDSAVAQTWQEGAIEGKIGDLSIGYPLYAIFGAVATADNADSDASVKDHTFTISQTSTPKTLTVAVSNPVADRRHALAVVDELEISSENSDWVKFTASMKAKSGVASSETVAFVAQNEFTSKNVTLKLAANLAGLSGATAADISNLSLKISRKNEMYFAHGTQDGSPSAMNSGPVEVEGEFVVRYNSTDYEDDWLANTSQAMEIKMVNNAVTIGSAAKPSLTFTLPQVKLWSHETSDDLDEIVTATVGFRGELNLTEGKLISAVLTNTQASYAAA